MARKPVKYHNDDPAVGDGIQDDILPQPRSNADVATDELMRGVGDEDPLLRIARLAGSEH